MNLYHKELLTIIFLTLTVVGIVIGIYGYIINQKYFTFLGLVISLPFACGCLFSSASVYFDKDYIVK